MSIAKKTMISMIEKMPDEKVMKILSFAKFVDNEEDDTLYLSTEEEEELVGLLENEDRVSGDVVLDEIMRVKG